MAWWPASWGGRDRRIDLWTDKGVLRAEAGALWCAPLSSHFGEFKGEMTVLADGAVYRGEAGCEVRLAAFDQKVVAVDNAKCGALNVRFSGFYTRHRLGEK